MGVFSCKFTKLFEKVFIICVKCSVRKQASVTVKNAMEARSPIIIKSPITRTPMGIITKGFIHNFNLHAMELKAPSILLSQNRAPPPIIIPSFQVFCFLLNCRRYNRIPPLSMRHMYRTQTHRWTHRPYHDQKDKRWKGSRTLRNHWCLPWTPLTRLQCSRLFSRWFPLQKSLWKYTWGSPKLP